MIWLDVFWLIGDLLVFQSSNTLASAEDTSITGTVVYRGQNEDSGSPRTAKSRLGLQERTFSAALEDSESNLAEVVFYMCDSIHSFLVYLFK